MATGWITGTFGLFGLNSDKDDIKIFWLNCVGVFLALCSVPVFSFITVNSKKKEEVKNGLEKKNDASTSHIDTHSNAEEVESDDTINSAVISDSYQEVDEHHRLLAKSHKQQLIKQKPKEELQSC